MLHIGRTAGVQQQCRLSADVGHTKAKTWFGREKVGTHPVEHTCDFRLPTYMQEHRTNDGLIA